MKLSSFVKGHRLKHVLRLCVCIVGCCVLTITGISINTQPVEAWQYAISGTPPDATNCQPYMFTFSVTPSVPSGCAPLTWAYAWATTPLPANMHFDPATGTISGTPVNAPPGTYSYKVWVIDNCGNTGPNLHFSITYQPCALSFVTTPIPPAQENVPYYVALSATGGTGPYTWTASGLPAGLHLDPGSGVISGTPLSSSTGTYTVAVSVTDACCSASHSGSFSLNVVYATYDFIVKIGPGLASGSTKVLIDGSEEATLGGGEFETFTVRAGRSHVVAVDKTVSSPGQGGARYTVKGSSDKTVNEDNDLAYFDYAPAVLIETSTNPAGVAQLPASGWYAIGDVFNASAPSPISPDSQQGVQYRFKQWKLPTGNTSPNRDLVFTVSAPGTATAVYDTYYLLTLTSDYPPVNDNNWYASGTTASYNLTTTDVPMLGFWGFIGGRMKASNASGTHVMDGPYRQTITWNYDFTIPIIVILVILLIIAAAVVLILYRRGAFGKKITPVAGNVTATKISADLAGDDTRVTTTKTRRSKKQVGSDTEGREGPGYCPKCGSLADKDASFCRKCGTKLS